MGVPEIIFNAAEPIPDFFQELSTELPQLAQAPNLFLLNSLFDSRIFKQKTFFKQLWEGSSAM